MALAPIKKQSVGEQVFNQLRENLLNGTWKAGEKIPSENELANAFGTSRVTVRQALSRLITLGLIETKLGEGSFVCEIRPGIYMKEIIPYVYLNSDSTREVQEFRLLIEVETAALAVDKVSDQDIDELEKIYHEMIYYKEKAKLEKYVCSDLEFHLKIASIADNSLINQILEIVQEIILETIKNITFNNGYDNGIKYHRMIIDALKAKQKDRMREVMRTHLSEVLEMYD